MRVFISHWGVEKPLALGLKSWLNTMGIGSFCSSDYDGIIDIGGWLTAIKQGLEQCEIGIFLLSPYSKDNKWIAYELGYLQSAGKQTRPLTFANLSHTSLAEMYTHNTVLSLDSSNASISFNSFCTNTLGLPDGNYYSDL